MNAVFSTISEATRLIAANELSPVQLIEAFFNRITITDSVINSYVTLMRDSALHAASASEDRALKGNLVSPLDGIGIAVKDVFDTSGVRTTAGSRAFADRVPTKDAAAVERLRQSGAVVLGKTNTPELTTSTTTENELFGVTRNPWCTDRSPGGSSGGSATAVVAGLALGALGTDTGGSIRIPASMCGITGHKPTYGLVSRSGVMPLCPSLDHAGPMARTAEDCALMLDCLAVYDPDDPGSIGRPKEDFTAHLNKGIEGLRIGVLSALAVDCDEAAKENIEKSIDIMKELGGVISECDLFRERENPFREILASEFAALYENHADKLEQRNVGLIKQGIEIKAVSYFKALRLRFEIEREAEKELAGYDIVVAPTTPTTAHLVSEPAKVGVNIRNTIWFNLTGQPGLSIPNGFDSNGLPTGLMIASSKWNDALVLRVGHTLQQHTDYHLLKPTTKSESA